MDLWPDGDLHLISAPGKRARATRPYSKIKKIAVSNKTEASASQASLASGVAALGLVAQETKKVVTDTVKQVVAPMVSGRSLLTVVNSYLTKDGTNFRIHFKLADHFTDSDLKMLHELKRELKAHLVAKNGDADCLHTSLYLTSPAQDCLDVVKSCEDIFKKYSIEYFNFENSEVTVAQENFRM